METWLAVTAVFVMFAFFLAEYVTFFYFKKHYGTLAAVAAAHVVMFVFGAGLLVPLEVLGVLDLVGSSYAMR